jgi:hypothetical protein
LDRRLGGPQGRSGCGGEEKNSQPLPGPEPPIIQPVAQRCNTEVFRLLPIVVRMTKSRRMRLAGHVERMSETRNAYTILVGKLEGKRQLARLGRRWKGHTEIDLKKEGMRMRRVLVNTVKDWEFLDHLSDC